MTTSGRGNCRVCGRNISLRFDPDARTMVLRMHGYRSMIPYASPGCEGSKDAPAGKPSIRTLAQVLAPEDYNQAHALGVGRWEHAVSSGPTKQRPGDQPLPTKNDAPYVQDQVMAYIERRKQVGISRYGTALQPFNGRDALVDAFEEVIDLAQYLGQLIIERDGKLP